MTGKTVAIAGAGDVAKYLVEELIKQGHHKVVVLSRAVRAPPSNCGFQHHYIVFLIMMLLSCAITNRTGRGSLRRRK